MNVQTMELRHVDPRLLQDNPYNPRRIASTAEADALLKANVAAVGVLQPLIVREEADGTLRIVYGHRRRDAAIANDLASIPALVTTEDPESDGVRALAENMVRSAMNPVDQWVAIEKLIGEHWNEEAIALAFAQPVRQIRKLRLLAHIHPAMLERMRAGVMPEERQLRTIALAAKDEQAQVWRKHKPRKGGEIDWWAIAGALSRRRMLAEHAKFDAEAAAAFKVTWSDDLFGPGGQDNPFTTDVEAFLAAQHQWIAENLPGNGVALILDQYGNPVLPKGAERLYGKPGKQDRIGFYVDPRDGQVQEIAFRPAQPKPSVRKAGTKADTDTTARPKPPLTRKGETMLGGHRRSQAVPGAPPSSPRSSWTARSPPTRQR